MNVARLRTFFYAFLMIQPLALVQFAEAKTFDCDAGNVQCLVSAISQANADPHQKTTIRLAGGTYALTEVDNDTDGPNGLPSIVSDVTIKGGQDGAILTRLAGALGFRILHVGASGHLTLQGVTITNPFDFASLSDPASGLFNDGGVVTVVDSSFIDNSIGDVGALYNNDGVVKIIDSAFVGNFGSGSAGVASAGGVVDILRTVFENNDGLGAGAVLSVDGDLRIAASHFSGNHGHLGGVVRVSGGTASIIQTTFAGNAGDPSGGILVEDQGAVTVRDSAFVENAGTGGTAIFNNGGTTGVINTTFAQNVTAFFGDGAVLNVTGTVTLINSTFAENISQGGIASAVASFSGATTLLQNTIVVHNGDAPFALCLGVVTSLGHNLIGDSSCIVAPQQGDVIGQADAGLGQLVDDGTAGNAHYLLVSDSPAIDAANDAVCPKKDQLGRPRAPRCDIGAIEFRRTDVTLATQ